MLLLFNARSLVNKVTELEHLLLSRSPPVVIVTETWINNDIPNDVVVPPGYRVFRWDRNSRGGGVAIVIKKCISAVPINCNLSESVWCKFTYANTNYLIGAVYRPPATSPEFLEDLQTFLNSNVNKTTKLVLAGDFNLPNIDWISLSAGNKDATSSEKLFEIMISHNLTQIVQQATRVTSGSQSLLDLVFLSGTMEDFSVTVEDGISDHKLISVEILCGTKPGKRPFVRVPVSDYGRADDTSILDFLETAFDDFKQASDSEPVDCLWQKLKSIINSCIERFVPIRLKKTRKTNPWITRDVIHTKRKIKRLRKRQGHSEQISQLRAALKIQISKSKKKFFNETLSGFLRTSPRKFWLYLSDRKEAIEHIAVGSDVVTQKQDIANGFNRFFQSVFTKMAFTDEDKEMADTCTCAMDPVSFDQAGVFQQLLNLNEKKANGPDGIPTVFLRRYAEWMSFYLVIIFEKSLLTHSLPKDWLSAIVKPVFKSGDRMLFTNYRPVSLTCVCCKVFEHVIAKQMAIFLETNGLICRQQHGFRQGLSTLSQLIETLHDFAAAVDNREQVDVICIDFAKAFDKVSHHKLLFKLKRTGVNENILKWIEAYLTNRKQLVRIDGFESESLDVYSGVPQGSVLGPLLFLVYINDVVDIVNPPVKIKLFADDCLIYAPVTCANDQIVINDCLDDFQTWCDKWEMKINYSKTTYTHITTKKHVLPFTYSIGPNYLPQVCAFKYLGVHITNDLKWRAHVENVCCASYRKLRFLRAKLPNATKDVKLLAYKTFVRPVLEYACAAWSPHQKDLIDKLERIQRLSARFICSKYKRTDSVTEMLKLSGLESLEIRRQKQRLKVFFQILHGQIKIDRTIYVHPPHKLSSRINHDAAVRPFGARTDVFRKSFFPDVIEAWNKLPRHIVENSDVKKFECALDVYFAEQ